MTSSYPSQRAFSCIARLLGIIPLHRRGTALTNYIYFFASLLIYYLLFFCVEEYASKVFDELAILSSAIAIRKAQYYFNLIYFPLLLLPSVRSGWKIALAYEEMRETDRILNYLNGRDEFSPVRKIKKDIVHIFTMMLTVILFNLTDYYSYLNKSRTSMYVVMWICDRLPEFFSVTMLSITTLWLLNVQSRFKKINKILRLMFEENPDESIAVTPTKVNEAYKLKLLNLSHGNLTRIATRVNEAYGLQLTLTIAIGFCYACAYIYIACVKCNARVDAVDLLTSILWIFFYVGKFTYITRTASTTVSQAKLASTYVPNGWTRPKNELTQEAKGFSWHMLSTKVPFSAGQCCTIDYAMLRSIICAWMIFGFLLIQFTSIRRSEN